MTDTQKAIKKDLRELQMAANIADTFHGRDCCAALDRIEAYIAALEAKAVPDGYVLVPIEPTDKKMQKIFNAWMDGPSDIRGAYKAMIAAAQEGK